MKNVLTILLCVSMILPARAAALAAELPEVQTEEEAPVLEETAEETEEEALPAEPAAEAEEAAEEAAPAEESAEIAEPAAEPAQEPVPAEEETEEVIEEDEALEGDLVKADPSAISFDPDDPEAIRMAEAYGTTVDGLKQAMAEDIAAQENGEGVYNTVAATNLTHSSVFSNRVLRWGIDVSAWQGNYIGKTIDWNKVKKDGCEFAIIRCGYTNLKKTFTMNQDPDFISFIKGAKAAGIKVGVYYFNQATTEAEAKKEAAKVLEIVGKAGVKLDLPIYMDVELTSGGRLEKAKLSKAAQNTIIDTFCSAIKAGGYKPAFYSYKAFLEARTNAAELTRKYPLWMAHYTTKTTYAGVYDMWQYSSSGAVKGINGKVDMNVWYDDSALKLAASKKLAAPTLKAKAAADAISLSWTKVEGAASYEVDAALTGQPLSKVASVTGTSYNYNKASLGKTYDLTVTALDEQGNAISKVSAIKTVKWTGFAEPSYKASNKLDGIKFSWTAVEGVSGYALYYNVGTSKGSWTYLCKVKADTTSYLLKKVKYNTKYYFAVRCLNSGGKTASPFTTSINKTWAPLSKPSFSVAYSSKGLKISWKEVANASGYRVEYCPSGGKWKKLKDLGAGKTSYTWNGAEVKTEYSFRVYALDSAGKKGSLTPTAVKGRHYLKTPGACKAKKDGSSVKITWGTCASASGYRVYYKTGSGKWKKLADVSGQKKSSYTWKKPSNGKKYTFRVAALDGNGKVVSANSKSASMTYKK